MISLPFKVYIQSPKPILLANPLKTGQDRIHLALLAFQRWRIHEIQLLHVLRVTVTARLAGAFDCFSNGVDFVVCEVDG